MFPRYLRLTNPSLICQHKHKHQILTQESHAIVRFPIPCDACVASYSAGEWEIMNDGTTALSILRAAIADGDVIVTRHSNNLFGFGINADWYGTPDQAALLERLLEEEERERRPDLYEDEPPTPEHWTPGEPTSGPFLPTE